MSLFRRFLRWLFPAKPFPVPLHAQRTKRPGPAPVRRPLAALAARLDMSAESLQSFEVGYHTFSIAKRSGGRRTIDAPGHALKHLQRKLLKRVFGPMRAHPAAHAFERKKSFVTNAAAHAHAAVVVRMDLVDFFPSITEFQVNRLCISLGWDEESAMVLARLCTCNARLPQGAPTSPKIANLLARRMDARLNHLAASKGAVYTRYADDLTFSFQSDDPRAVRQLIRAVHYLVDDSWDAPMKVHRKHKLSIRRRSHQSVRVTGLVVNELPRLPRSTRRWLRAVDHRAATGGTPTLTPAQRQGWRSLENMIDRQRTG